MDKNDFQLTFDHSYTPYYLFWYTFSSFLFIPTYETTFRKEIYNLLLFIRREKMIL